MATDAYYTSPVGSVEHRAAYAELHRAAAEVGCETHPDVDIAYEIDNAGELAAENAPEPPPEVFAEWEADPWPDFGPEAGL